MQLLTNIIGRNKLASAIFALYAVLWLGLSVWTATARQGQGDACARGMLLYPALLALAGSLLYAFVLLLSWFSARETGGFTLH